MKVLANDLRLVEQPFVAFQTKADSQVIDETIAGVDEMIAGVDVVGFSCNVQFDSDIGIIVDDRRHSPSPSRANTFQLDQRCES